MTERVHLQNRRRNDDNRKKTIVKIAIMLFLLLFVLIFATIAWFSMNKNIGISGASISLKEEDFVIQVEGEYQENGTLFEKVNQVLFGNNATSIYGDGYQPAANTAVFQTSSTNDKVIWRKDALTSQNGHYESGIEPNSSGKLVFWVVAKEAGVIDPTFTFDIKGFHAVTHNEQQGTTSVEVVDHLFEINSDLIDHATTDPSLTSSVCAKKNAALGYANGHMLFFRELDENGYYSGFLGADRSFKLSDVYPEAGGTTFTANEAKQVVVYWKWANTFEQMVYDSNYPSYSPLMEDASSADMTSLYDYLSPSNSSVFYGLSNQQITSDLAIVQSNGSGYADAMTSLSDAYNDADQEIGDMVNYILIEMTVTD